jgi:hypothetical protein
VRWAGVVFLVVAGILALVISLLTNSEAMKLAAARVSTHQGAIEVLGAPIETGLPQGRISVANGTGTADLTFEVRGPRGEGRVRVQATKTEEQWVIRQLLLSTSARGPVLDLLK